MNNHYHVVLRIDRDRVRQWTDAEVLTRWTQLFRGPLLVRRQLEGGQLNEVERQTVIEIARVWRGRLYDVSWFMRCLNEHIARRANAEDECTGRFWEGRFKSQALLDEAALLSCMAYVDLNPVRAGIAASLTDADFTSVSERLRAASSASPGARSASTPEQLMPFAEGWPESTTQECLPASLEDYVALVEGTGRCIGLNKRSALPEGARSALARLRLSDEAWLGLTLEIRGSTLQAVGGIARLRRYGTASGRRWIRGSRKLARLYNMA